MKRIKLTLSSPKAILLISCVLVGASTLALMLFRPWPWTRLAMDIQIFSEYFGDIIVPGTYESQGIVPIQLALATSLNLALFSLPALPVVVLFGRRFPDVISRLVIGWLVVYLLVLFV